MITEETNPEELETTPTIPEETPAEATVSEATPVEETVVEETVVEETVVEEAAVEETVVEEAAVEETVVEAAAPAEVVFPVVEEKAVEFPVLDLTKATKESILAFYEQLKAILQVSASSANFKKVDELTKEVRTFWEAIKQGERAEALAAFKGGNDDSVKAPGTTISL